MARTTDIGTNRTGLAMAPDLSQEMLEITREGTPEPGDRTPMAAMRRNFASNAHPLGTMPAPASLKEAATTAKEMLKGHRATVLLDKLGERLAFERTGVRLYDAVLTKYDALGSYPGGPSRADIERIRNEELEHFHLVRETMEKLGGDSTAVTPSADFVGVATSGIMKAVSDPSTTLPQCLQAMLTAEETDRASWGLLIELAETFNQTPLIEPFREAEQVEARHARDVHDWVKAAISADAEGEMG